MKKTIFVINLIILLFGVNIQAKVLFDLHEQYFKNTLLDKKGNYTPKGRYNLPNVFVSTNTYFKNGSYYGHRDSPAYFSIDLKTPPKEWSVTLTIYHYYTPNIIRISSSNGKSDIVALKEKKNLSINDEKYETYISGRTSQIAFKYTNQTITIYFNGEPAFKEKQKDFNNLKKIEILIGSADLETYRGKLSSLQIFEGN
jgi:hypothetical protein